VKTVTLTELLADVRALYEIRDNALSDTILTRWLNQAIATVHDKIANINPDQVTTGAYTLSVVSGTASYTLSSIIATFYKGMGLDLLLEDGVTYYSIGTFPWEERHLFAGRNVGREDTRYRYMGDTLWLAPNPTFSCSAIVRYIPVFTKLTTGASTWDTVDGWDELAVAMVAIKCAIKEQSSAVKDLQALRDYYQAHVEQMAKQRDFSHHDRVRDTRLQRLQRADPFARLPRPR
jgi:hypothetical protein